MPTITPAHLYTFAALLAVSGLLVLSFMSYASALRASSETKDLKNLVDSLAARSMELLNLAVNSNATANAFLNMPTRVGDRQYWIRLDNDSSKAWLEGGFGNMPAQETELRAYLQSKVQATGQFVGGSGAVSLKCQIENGVAHIQIISSREDV